MSKQEIPLSREMLGIFSPLSGKLFPKHPKACESGLNFSSLKGFRNLSLSRNFPKEIFQFFDEIPAWFIFMSYIFC